MFHFNFSNEKEAQGCLDAGQLKRVHHVRVSHQCMKDLNDALTEAVRHHDRYLASIEKVINLLALHNDTFEDAREQLGDCGAVIVPTHAAAEQLCNAYNAWKVSEELAALRKELEVLKELTDSGRQMTKRSKTNVENLEKYAIRCAAVNSAEHASKIAGRSGKSKEKLLGEQRELNAKLATLDATVCQDVQTTGSWWSEKLVSHCDAVYAVFANLGRCTVVTFPLTQTPSSLSQPAPTRQLPPAVSAASASPSAINNASGVPPSLYANYATGGPVVGQPSTAVHSANGGYANGNAEAGVPLEFQTSRANAQHTKTVD